MNDEPSPIDLWQQRCHIFNCLDKNYRIKSVNNKY